MSLVVEWLSVLGMLVTGVSSGSPTTAWQTVHRVATSALEFPHHLTCALLSGVMQLSLPLQNYHYQNSSLVMVAAVETAHPGKIPLILKSSGPECLAPSVLSALATAQQTAAQDVCAAVTAP